MDADRARKNETIILQRLMLIGQAHVAECVGISEPTMSRFKQDDIGRFAKVLAALDLKAVPVGFKCVDPKTMQMLLHGHRMWVNSIEDHNDLMQDEA